jgi:hypothetical protein
VDARTIAGVVLLCVVSLVSNLQLLEAVLRFRLHQTEQDGVSSFEQRLAQLKQRLPSSGVIGYFGDPNVAPDDVDSTATYYLTQYTLAPIVVVRNTGQRYAIGVFNSAPPSAEDLRARGLALMQDFGGGVQLLRREGQ